VSKDNIDGTCIIGYVAMVAVAYGFFVKSMFAAFGPSIAHIIFGIPVAAFWPVSGLIWLGVWLA